MKLAVLEGVSFVRAVVRRFGSPIAILGGPLARGLFALLCLLSVAAIASATTYYVDGSLSANITNGHYSIANRNATGTDGNAYNTVQGAVTAATVNGDVIIVRGGTYYPTAATIFTRRATAAAYMELKSFPGEVPVINGQNIPGDGTNVSTPTWTFNGAQYWKVTGPLVITRGVGPGVNLDEGSGSVSSRFLTFTQIESSYNGWLSKNGGHGFFVWEGDDITFQNCDAHHNANHAWNTSATGGQACNQYQHGDGWRIWGDSTIDNSNVKLIGCRSWHNLDDAYDLAGTNSAVTFTNCWAAYEGKDDAQGTITGTPNFVVPGDAAGVPFFPQPLWWGNAFKLGYAEEYGTNSTEANQLTGCIAWGSLLNGFHVNKGPCTLLNCASFNNGGSGFHFYSDGVAHQLRNCWELGNGQPIRFYDPNALAYTTGILTNSSHNSWDATAGFTVTAADFINTIDDSIMLGPRQADGSLPNCDFLRLANGSDLIDKGVDVGLAYNGSAPDIGPFEFVGAPAATVAGRRVFYNNSAFDANNPAANANDDGAIATDKQALLPGGTATFANYTSYSRGINGVMIDIAGLTGTPTSSDFEIKVGNDDTPGSWVAGPAPTVSIRAGAGTGGSARVTLTWADGQIANKWLRVRVLVTGNTGLSSEDVFYFGNAIGETGNSTGDAEVTPADQVVVRNDPHSLSLSPAAVDDHCDFDRDHKVGPADAIMCRNNGTNSSTALKLINVP